MQSYTEIMSACFIFVCVRGKPHVGVQLWPTISPKEKKKSIVSLAFFYIFILFYFAVGILCAFGAR